ncbi:MAG: aminotransferase class IV [Chloroflexi bacterium]|nr:aminotransferase class IV [Chloroflexota bacterium]
MPCMIRLLTAQGLQPVSYSADSLAAAAAFEAHDGVYTITNTYNTFQVLKFDAHLDRLEDSARREQIQLRLDRVGLRAALRQMIAEAGYGDVRFRITIERQNPQALILSLEPFAPLAAEIRARGVRCITAGSAARHHPEAKTINWLHDRKQIEQSLSPGIYTALLLSPEGHILEGLSSNFYAILEGELRSAGAGVLPGIAQQVVYTVAPHILPLRKVAVNVRDLPRLDEAFITSSSRGVLAVVEIDGQQIGAGTPGVKTLAISQAYNHWVQMHLEDL